MFEVKEIQKSYPNKEVLKGVSFSIEKGDRIAFLGNNGAGKSTLLKIIAGQIPANAGHIQTSLDYRTEIGMMPQGDILIEDLTVSEIVKLKGCMNHLPKIDLEAALKKVSLQEFRNQYVGGLSGGQKRRLSLLLTILNAPKLIFLDEPTTGMDLEPVDVKKRKLHFPHCDARFQPDRSLFYQSIDLKERQNRRRRFGIRHSP